MEIFESIDWLPNVEDIIDDKFVDEERLQKEGAMYSILNGTFQDPFGDIRTHNYQPKKKPSPKKMNSGKPKKINQNAENSEDTPKRPRGRPKKNKD